MQVVSGSFLRLLLMNLFIAPHMEFCDSWAVCQAPCLTVNSSNRRALSESRGCLGGWHKTRVTPLMSVACFSCFLCSFLTYLRGTYYAPAPGCASGLQQGLSWQDSCPGRADGVEGELDKKNRTDRKGFGGMSSVQRIKTDLGTWPGRPFGGVHLSGGLQAGREPPQESWEERGSRQRKQ